MKPSEKKRLGAGRVAFLARAATIKERIDAGYTMASIYEDYQRELGIGYKQFVNYVNKFVRGKQEAKRAETPELHSETDAAVIPPPPMATIAEDGGRDFKNDAEELAKRDEDLF